MIKSDKDLAKSEIDYKEIFHNSQLPIGLIDTNGIIVEVNKAVENLVGINRNSLIGKNYLSNNTFPRKYNSIMKQRFKRLINGEILKPIEIEIYAKNKKLIWVKVFTTLLNSSNKTIFQTIFYDINKEKTIEQKLKESEELIKKENLKLKELDNFRRDFINRISHELKNPLTTICASAELLNDNSLSGNIEESKEIIGIILKSSQNLKDVIKDLLDSSQIDSGKLDIKLYKNNLSKIIKNSMSQMSLFFKERKINVIENISDDIYLNIDKSRIEQVIINLLSNAVKNTPPAGEININLIKNNGFAELSIKDTGIGLTKNEKTKLFKRFSRFQRNRVARDIIREGSGLGLFITKEIVEMHNGDIIAESEGRYKGSTFTIRLPIH